MPLFTFEPTFVSYFLIILRFVRVIVSIFWCTVREHNRAQSITRKNVLCVNCIDARLIIKRTIEIETHREWLIWRRRKNGKEWFYFTKSPYPYSNNRFDCTRPSRIHDYRLQSRFNKEKNYVVVIYAWIFSHPFMDYGIHYFEHCVACGRKIGRLLHSTKSRLLLNVIKKNRSELSNSNKWHNFSRRSILVVYGSHRMSSVQYKFKTS